MPLIVFQLLFGGLALLIAAALGWSGAPAALPAIAALWAAILCWASAALHLSRDDGPFPDAARAFLGEGLPELVLPSDAHTEHASDPPTTAYERLLFRINPLAPDHHTAMRLAETPWSWAPLSAVLPAAALAPSALMAAQWALGGGPAGPVDAALFPAEPPDTAQLAAVAALWLGIALTLCGKALRVWHWDPTPGSLLRLAGLLPVGLGGVAALVIGPTPLAWTALLGLMFLAVHSGVTLGFLAAMLAIHGATAVSLGIGGGAGLGGLFALGFGAGAALLVAAGARRNHGGAAHLLAIGGALALLPAIAREVGPAMARGADTAQLGQFYWGMVPLIAAAAFLPCWSASHALLRRGVEGRSAGAMLAAAASAAAIAALTFVLHGAALTAAFAWLSVLAHASIADMQATLLAVESDPAAHWGLIALVAAPCAPALLHLAAALADALALVPPALAARLRRHVVRPYGWSVAGIAAAPLWALCTLLLTLAAAELLWLGWSAACAIGDAALQLFIAIADGIGAPQIAPPAAAQ